MVRNSSPPGSQPVPEQEADTEGNRIIDFQISESMSIVGFNNNFNTICAEISALCNFKVQIH
jgi:hypothetical protein